MQNNEHQLNELLKLELNNQLSSQEEDDKSTYQIPQSKNQYRKPIKNPFSDQSDSSDSDVQNVIQKTISPFPPKQPKPVSVLQQAQSEMKWNRDQQKQTELLMKLQGQGMKDKKIRELANKYKNLNIAYEKQKTIRKSLQNQLNSQIKISQQAKNRSIQKDHSMSIKSLDKSEVKEAKCTNSTCLQNQKKVMQFRLQSQNLKNQLNKAMRVIAKQVGQNFSIDQILNDQNSWKGRQQKIQKLKGRVKQLQEKLSNNGVNVSHMSGFTEMSSATRTNNNFSNTRTSTLVQNKRKQFDNLKIQVQALKSENDLVQGKIKSITSRKLILQNQLKQLKQQFQKKKLIFMQKSENDDKFISLLKAENQKLKKDQRVVTKVVYKQGKDNDQVFSLKRQIQRLKQRLKSVNNNSKQQQKKLQIQAKEKQSNPATLKQKTSQKCLQEIDFMPLTNMKQQVQKRQKISSSNSISNNTRDLSSQRKKQLQNEYLKGNKYLKKMSTQDEMEIYNRWKQTKKVN